MIREETRDHVAVVLGVGATLLLALTIGSEGRNQGGGDAALAPVVVESTAKVYEHSDELATTLFADPELISGVRVSSPDPDRAIDFVSVDGGEAPRLLLTTGELADDTTSQANTGEVLSDKPDTSRGGAFDVTVVEVDFMVPDGMSCLEVPRLQFGTDEPVSESDSPADGFVIELDESTWSTEGDGSSASDELVHLGVSDSAGLESKFAKGLGFEVATPELQVATPIEPGRHTLLLSVYDAANALGSSGVSIGGLRLSGAAACDGTTKLADPTKLVALGDSNTAGFGLPPFETGTDDAGNGCQRSTNSYPAQLAELGGYELTSVACSGAKTKHLYEANTSAGEPPQFEALEADTAVVVLTIGANDTAWAQKLQSCVIDSIFGPPCNRDAGINQKFDKVFEQLDDEASQPTEVRPYTEIFSDVQTRSPYAQVIFVSYPTLFPATGGSDGNGLFQSNRCMGVLESDQRWANDRMASLAVIAEDAADEADVSLVNPTSEFSGHELCGKSPWFMGLAEPGPLHPNGAGHEAIAARVFAEVDDQP